MTNQPTPSAGVITMTDLASWMAANSLAWLAIVLAASWCSALAYPAYRRLAGSGSPRLRAAGILTCALLPPLIATLVVGLLNQPALTGALLPDHCHSALCGPHTPELAASAGVGAALLSFVTAVLVAFGAFVYYVIKKNYQRTVTLDAVSNPGSDRNCRIVDSDELLAWCGGLWRSRIYISQGLISLLNTRQLQVVLAHEQTHAIRRDNLRKFVLHWLTLLWPAPIRQRLEADFSDACEQLCDEAAVREVGSTALVAEVIELLASSTSRQYRERLSAFATHAHRSRLTTLEPVTTNPRFVIYSWFLIAIIWVSQVGLFTRAAHPALEWLLR